MSEESIASRVTKAAVLSATAAALLLAVCATALAWMSWEKRVRRRVEAQADAVESAVRSDLADEPGLSIRDFVADSLGEAALGDARAEMWEGGRLLATSTPGQPPLVAAPGGPPRAGWSVARRELPKGFTLVLGVPDDRSDVQRVFLFSLLAALPPSLLLAAAAGRWAARRATGPLSELTGRLGGLEDPAGWKAGVADGAPEEVVLLERAFTQLLERIAAALAREAGFAANAAHELRTPLTRMRLEAERARSGAAGEGREAIDALLGELDRLSRIVDGLLLLAREERVRTDDGGVVNLADVARETAARVFQGKGKALSLPDEALIPGDERLLSVALENLFENARKFAAPGLTPRVEVAHESGSVVCRVRTPGASLDPEERSRAFERFFRGARARAATEGSGLGLALAFRVARLHGGSLELDEAPDGVVTTLRLPGWQAAARPAG